MGRFYGSIEDANKASAVRVRDLRDAAGYAVAVQKVIRQFDGKVYNCRFEKAMQEATNKKVHVDKDNYRLTIYVYGSQNYANRFILSEVRIEELTDGKRIPADKLLESLRTSRESLLRRAYEIETGVESMPQIKAYITETRDKLEKYIRKLPDELRELYGLPYCVRLD